MQKRVPRVQLNGMSVTQTMKQCLREEDIGLVGRMLQEDQAALGERSTTVSKRSQSKSGPLSKVSSTNSDIA